MAVRRIKNHGKWVWQARVAFHDLRHHGATMALNKGFTAPIVMALGGWKRSG